jgi:hypothetical protein
MKTILLMLIATLGFLFPMNAQAQADRPRDPGTSGAGWKPLFDGRTLDGWEHVGPGRFVIDNGILRTEGGMGLLWYSREKLGNCVLRVVYKTVTPQANSGVYIRIADRPKDEWFAVHHGYEVQIMDAAPGSRGTGSIYTFAEAKARPAKAGEWNTLEITLKGNRVLTTINGVPVAEFDPSGPIPERKDTSPHGDPERGPRPESGFFGLQNHDENSTVEFKEVSVRPLSPGSP